MNLITLTMNTNSVMGMDPSIYDGGRGLGHKDLGKWLVGALSKCEINFIVRFSKPW